MSHPGPYYSPGGMDYSRRPGGTRWLPIVIAIVLLGVAVLLLLLLLYHGSFGMASPSNRFGLFGGVFVLFFVLMIGFFMVRVAFWGTRTGRYSRRTGSGY